MRELIFATHNKHKLEEVQALMPAGIRLITLDAAGVTEDIPETGTTLEENALIKADYVYKKFGKDCFAEDTGLEVTVLKGEPGVYSARYAGTHGDAAANMEKLLTRLEGAADRSACFRTIFALILDGRVHTFEGEVWGQILPKKQGNSGFGYDPIFLPDGFQQSFAEMDASEKNAISHRSRALAKMLEFLHSLPE